MPKPSPSSPQPRPLSARKIDVFYITFLSFFVFLALTIDLIPLYPISLQPYTSFLYDYFRTTYNDPLYFKDPPFFRLYIIVEAVYTVPMCLWSIRGLTHDDTTTPLHLLVLATHLLSSTAVCFVEVLGTQDWPREVINKNVPGYVGFGVVAAFLWVDMFMRVRSSMRGKAKLG